MSEQYPDTFDQYYRPLYEKAARMQADGNRLFNGGLIMLCQVCQIPPLYPEPGNPAKIVTHHGQYDGERYNFCSEHCKWIFEREPRKYIQALLPIYQIFQGNCGGTTIPEVLKWYGAEAPYDGGEYTTSRDAENWTKWHAPAGVTS